MGLSPGQLGLMYNAATLSRDQCQLYLESREVCVNVDGAPVGPQHATRAKSQAINWGGNNDPAMCSIGHVMYKYVGLFTAITVHVIDRRGKCHVN